MAVHRFQLEDPALGAEILSLRESEGKSQAEVAKALGISAPFLAHVELGRYLPSAELTLRMSRYYRVSLTRLLKLLLEDRLTVTRLRIAEEHAVLVMENETQPKLRLAALLDKDEREVSKRPRARRAIPPSGQLA